MKLTENYTSFLNEEEGFNYTYIAKDMWYELIKKAKEEYNIYFDLENDDSVSDYRVIRFPVFKDEDGKEFGKGRKFLCQMFKAGGDWEVPVIYFRCQLQGGHLNSKITDNGKYRMDKCFVVIPNKENGNYHLVKEKDKWMAPNNNYYKKDIDPEPSEKDSWKYLNFFLKELVTKADGYQLQVWNKNSLPENSKDQEAK